MTPARNEDQPVCRRLLYTGRVQGVGFRYTTASIAKHYPVRGYVKNLSNGSVELVVSGTAGTVERFLSEVGTSFAGQIEQCSSQEHLPPEDFDRFEIRY